MSQFLMRKEKDSKNLRKVIEKYTPLWFNARPFSLGNSKIVVSYDLQDKKFDFIFSNGLKFLSDKDLIFLPLKNYDCGFKMEYRDGGGIFNPPEGRRINPNYLHPNDKQMPKVYQSVLINVIDYLLIEISFKGKIELEFDGENYWKVK